MAEKCLKHNVFKYPCDRWGKTDRKHGDCRENHEFGLVFDSDDLTYDGV